MHTIRYFYLIFSTYVVLFTSCHAEEPQATKASPHFLFPCHAEERSDEGISAQSAVNVLIIGLASEDCYVVLRTPHNDKEYVIQRSRRRRRHPRTLVR